ncbi:MAG: carbon storage regulator [Oscillospiraceae bacterium]|jgi:carbon storage regulator|nr:carbon storage regulator [Oscillospiraceae bacterium]
MLLLSVKEGDYIMIGDGIKVKIIDGRGVSKIGVEAPRGVPVLRRAVYERSRGKAPEAPEAAPETVSDL